MTAIHNIEEKLEDALSEVINARLDANVKSEVTILVGLGDAAMQRPCITILAHDAEPLALGEQMGNYNVPVTMMVQTHFQEHTRAEHGEMVAALRDVVYRDDFLALVNNTASEVTTYLITPKACPRGIVDEKYRSTGIIVDFECIPK
jgi:hypothetical protein